MKHKNDKYIIIFLDGSKKEFTSLVGVNFNNACLRGAYFKGADLTGANLSYANLKGANLRGANLTGVTLSNASLIGANLEWARFPNADLTYADLQNANLNNASLTGATLSNANLQDADFSNASLSHVIGNNREIKTLQLGNWTTVITKDVIAIGCRQHPAKDWFEFSDKDIDSMDKNALEWWNTWKDVIRRVWETM